MADQPEQTYLQIVFVVEQALESYILLRYLLNPWLYP